MRTVVVLTVLFLSLTSFADVELPAFPRMPQAYKKRGGLQKQLQTIGDEY